MDWNKIQNLLELSSLISPTDIILFDMDNTLINTDKANNESYKSAIRQVLGQEYDDLFIDLTRICREDVKKRLFGISEEQLKDIVSMKSIIYNDNINQTSLETDVVELLENISTTNKCILVSNACANRVNQTLEYYNLKDKFYSIITSEDCKDVCDKFDAAIRKLQLEPDSLWIIENEQKNIEIALKLNIKHLILKENENFYYFTKSVSK